MLVIDASALIELLTTEPTRTRDLSRRIRSADWMSAPALIDYEVHNVLRKMVFRRVIDAAVAKESLSTFWSLRIGRYELTEKMSGRLWELRENVSAYDAAYVALAEELNVPLVTTERRLAEAVHGRTTATIESFLTGK